MLQLCHHTAVFMPTCHRIGLHAAQTHNRRQHKTAPMPEDKNRRFMPKPLKSFIINDFFTTCKIHKPNQQRHNSGDNPLKNRQPQNRFPKFFPKFSKHSTAILATKKTDFKHTLATTPPPQHNKTNKNLDNVLFCIIL